ncbi:MAG TPA: four helix bundle protein [Chthoniobacterales bacterium]
MNKLDRAKQFQDRTKMFAIKIIHVFTALPKLEPARIIGRQFLRSGTSVAANYRAASRARSKVADETLFWLDLLVDSGLVRLEVVEPLRIECNELVRIFSSSLATAKSNRSITHSPAR